MAGRASYSLSPLNTNVSCLNNWLMREFPGEERMYRSVDSAICDDEAVSYPVQLLNSIGESGILPHILKLNLRVPIMILRNMDQPKVTNGTRCIVTLIHPKVIEATISFEPYKAKRISYYHASPSYHPTQNLSSFDDCNFRVVPALR